MIRRLLRKAIWNTRIYDDLRRLGDERELKAWERFLEAWLNLPAASNGSS